MSSNEPKRAETLTDAKINELDNKFIEIRPNAMIWTNESTGGITLIHNGRQFQYSRTNPADTVALENKLTVIQEFTRIKNEYADALNKSGSFVILDHNNDSINFIRFAEVELGTKYDEVEPFPDQIITYDVNNQAELDQLKKTLSDMKSILRTVDGLKKDFTTVFNQPQYIELTSLNNISPPSPPSCIRLGIAGEEITYDVAIPEQLEALNNVLNNQREVLDKKMGVVKQPATLLDQENAIAEMERRDPNFFMEIEVETMRERLVFLEQHLQALEAVRDESVGEVEYDIEVKNVSSEIAAIKTDLKAAEAIAKQTQGNTAQPLNDKRVNANAVTGAHPATTASTGPATVYGQLVQDSEYSPEVTRQLDILSKSAKELLQSFTGSEHERAQLEAIDAQIRAITTPPAGPTDVMEMIAALGPKRDVAISTLVEQQEKLFELNNQHKSPLSKSEESSLDSQIESLKTTVKNSQQHLDGIYMEIDNLNKILKALSPKTEVVTFATPKMINEDGPTPAIVTQAQPIPDGEPRTSNNPVTAFLKSCAEHIMKVVERVKNGLFKAKANDAANNTSAPQDTEEAGKKLGK